MSDLIKNLMVIDETDYHEQSGTRFLSSHRLQACREANDCKAFWDGQQLEDTQGFLRFGRMVHLYTLEGPESFFEQHTVIGGPQGPRGGYKAPHEITAAEAQEWKNKNNGSDWVTPRELQKLQGMAESAWKCGNKFLESGWAELTARSVIRGVHCQGRIDWISESGGGCIVDLKTTRSIKMLPGQIAKFGYLNQMAFYQMLYCLATNQDPPDVYILGVEKQKPFASKLIKCEQYKLDEKRKTNLCWIDRLRFYLQQQKGGKQWTKAQKILA